MVRQIIRKDPDEVRIETMDWSGRLNVAATIVSSNWTLPSGLTAIADGIVAGALKSFVKFSGGEHGTDYTLTNTIVTSDGETLEDSGRMQVRNSTGVA